MEAAQKRFPNHLCPATKFMRRPIWE